MKDQLAGAMWRLAIYLVVCVVGFVALVMVFAQWRFEERQVYTAQFTDVSGLAEGNFVRIAGVEVGKVKNIAIEPNTVVTVQFSVDDSVVLTEGTRAAVRWADMLGGRFLALEEGAGNPQRLRPGQAIPVERTEPALRLDALIGGFRPLFRVLDPDQVNALSSQLIQAFQGQGASIKSFLAQAAELTSSLADRDQLIDQIIANLNSVLASFGDQSNQLAKAIDSLGQLTQGLASRKNDISDSIASTDAAATTFADLLDRARVPFKSTVAQTDRAAGIVVADHDYFDDLINTLPDAYQILNRQGMYGDFFSFYLCDVVLKLNGKGGQPVYVKVAGQTSGRCTPK